MAVLKSFELNGNKKSFANWISNLSPTSTPFTSMIGKEEIDQTQYSWQTDSLAPATSETFAEGSHATYQPRATTNVFTNFTSLIRRAVRVSDTNECTHSYGRRDEMAYQMGKAGQSVLRDVEYMNLSTRTGVPGSPTRASAHSGFKDLCAPLFMPDTDTFALTHQGVAVVDPSKPWFALKDIFKVTTELFLSGSRADKIMFHPKHINIFSDHIGYNEEEPQIFRMFDGLDTKYNALVSKIKDPVGRVYTLIPNRWMPEGEVYIFSEDDWTQMVLQQPVRKKIAKQGSSSVTYVETEVGLRHKHPHASGVLSLVVVKYKATITPNKNKLTAFVTDEELASIVSVKNPDGSPAAGVEVTLKAAPEGIIDLHTDVLTTDGNGEYHLESYAMKPGKVVFYGHSEVQGKELLTNPVAIEVVPPTVNFLLEGNRNPRAFKQSTMHVTFLKADGTPIANTPTFIYADEGNEVAGLAGNKFTTDANGVATVHFTPTVIDRINFRAQMFDHRGDWETFPYQLEVEDNTIQISFAPGTENILTKNIDGTQSVAFHVTEDGEPLSGIDVKVESSVTAALEFTGNSYKTNADGVATTQLLIHDIGTSTITASYLNKKTVLDFHVGTGSMVLTLDKSSVEISDTSNITATAQIFKANGEPARKAGLELSWGSIPDEMNLDFENPRTVTNDQGVSTNLVNAGDVVAKGQIKAYWSQNDVFGSADFEVARLKFKAEFTEKEITVIGGVGLETELVSGITHPWASAAGRVLKFYSSNEQQVVWVKPEGTTKDGGWVDPNNSIRTVGFGTTILTVTGTDTETEEYEAGNLTVHTVRPKISVAATKREMLIGDKGQLTIVMLDLEGNAVDFTGEAEFIYDASVLTAPKKIDFNAGRVTVDYEGRALGESEIGICLAGSINLPVNGNGVIRVVHPTLRVTSIPDTYGAGEEVTIKAILGRPNISTGDLSGRTVTFLINPDVLPGVTSGIKAVTDKDGNATIKTGKMSGDLTYEINASLNGTAARYFLEPDV